MTENEIREDYESCVDFLETENNRRQEINYKLLRNGQDAIYAPYNIPTYEEYKNKYKEGKNE